MKTLEEIRAEKLARSQSPKENSSNSDTISFATKRSAPQGNKQIRIKRPKLSAEMDSITSSVQVPSNEDEKTFTSPPPAHTITVEPVPESTETDDYLEGDADDDDDQGNTGSLNDDELLLEIDNILGD